MGARVYACRRQLWFSADACRNKHLRSAGKAKQYRPVGRKDKSRDPPCAVSFGKDKNWGEPCAVSVGKDKNWGEPCAVSVGKEKNRDKPLALDVNVSYEPWML